ncbi:unnamed protein product [Durusdinium trenchii]|uniref:Carboxylic ester hydrolase n=1 Tax=Durusdinium trenchii TaxID=1381693 RepID=A0ABP0QWS0_9DINO
MRLFLVAWLIHTSTAQPAGRGEDHEGDSDPRVVQTVNGPVRGVYRDLFHHGLTWWGLRYAAPPLGVRRWRPPEVYDEQWGPGSVKPAETIPPACLQLGGSETKGQEDCLFLNVFAPREAKDLPVLVFFYGGGFVEGSSYEMGLYDGHHVSVRHQVLVVTLNYRLWSLGFMALDALQAEATAIGGGSTGNHGVQDQRLALQWVQQNIRHFGGDPRRVTIFGESAGAFSVMWHLVSPQSKGLFQAAIMESGTSDVSFFFQPLPQAKAYYEDLAERLQCPKSLGVWQLPCLRALPAERLVEVEAGLDGQRPAVHSPLWPLMPNGPAIDGTESGLLDVPIELVRRGHFNKVPLLLGSNENGGSIFEPMLPMVLPGTELPVKRHPETLQKALKYFFHENVEAIYNLWEFPDGDVLIRRMIRDLMFMCPLRALATAWHQNQLNSYVYVFDFSYGLVSWLGLGDFHGSELPFVFRNWLELIKPIDLFQSPHRMSDIISCNWASFAYRQDRCTSHAERIK